MRLIILGDKRLHTGNNFDNGTVMNLLINKLAFWLKYFNFPLGSFCIFVRV